MNTDIRISTEICRNPKILKLRRRIRPDPFFNLICLWTWVAINKPDGDLSGMDGEAIEIAAAWEGEPGLFTDTLCQLRFIVDKNNDSLTTVNGVDNEKPVGCFVNEWREHNPWAADAEMRSNKSRLSRLAYVCPELHAALVATGKTGISKAEYEDKLAEWRKKEHGNGCCHKKKK